MADDAALRLGVRGRIRTGPDAGAQVLIDSVGMTPVDPLVVIVSPDLNQPGHSAERVEWVNPVQIRSVIEGWTVEWSTIRDDQAERFA